MVRIPTPKTFEGHDGHFTMTYGPDVLRDNPHFSSAVGLTIAYIADAERHLAYILESLVAGDSRVLRVLLASFRGYKQLLGAVEASLDAVEHEKNLETFRAIKLPIERIWEVRDSFGHGIWAKSSEFPKAAIRMSAKSLGKTEEGVRRMLAEGKFEEAIRSLDDTPSELWTAADFSDAALAAAGAVNSLMAFSSCISRSPEEAAHIHTALRSQGLLSTPPWQLPTPTPPQGTA